MIESIIMPVLAEDGAAEAASGVEVVRAMLIVLGIVIIAVMLVIHTMGKIARRKSRRPSAREQIEQAKAGGGAGGRRWRAGMSADESAGSARRSGRVSAAEVEEARHFAALLDNKAERLEQLLAEAEERIARLEKLMRMRPDRDAEALRGGDRIDTPVASANHDQCSAVPPAEPADPLTRSVYELADQGHDSVEIAQKLDEQVGKIDLILALRP